MKQFPMVKKALIFLLAAAATFTIAGCSDSGSGSSSASTVSESAAASVSEVSPESSETASETSSEASSAEPESAEAADIGEGETAFAFTVTFADGTSAHYNVHTDETTVGAALQALGLIEGDESEYGLYVTAVDGVTLDYDTDGKYWAFYVGGAYATSGVDTTDIVPGESYEMRAENA